jgi:hypothetical protein
MYNICKLKNISGETQDIRKYWNIDEEYLIPDNLRVAYANDNNIISAITNNILQVGDGVTYLTDVATQIQYLLSILPKDVIITNEPRIEYTSRYFAKGDAVMVDCPANTTTNIDLLVNNKTAESAILENESYTSKYLRGGEVFGTNIQVGDNCKFQVIDKDGWLVATGQMTQQMFDSLKVDGGIVLKEYYYKRYIYPNDKNVLKSETPGQIPVGVYLRAKYTAIDSGETRKIVINYDIENKD